MLQLKANKTQYGLIMPDFARSKEIGKRIVKK
jgi:hypothetical protein